MNLEIENAYHLITEKLEVWIETAIQMLPNFLIAILVIVIFVIIGKFGKKNKLSAFGQSNRQS